MNLKQVATYIFKNNKYAYNNNTTIEEIEKILRMYIQVSVAWNKYYTAVNPSEGKPVYLTDIWQRTIYKMMKNISEAQLVKDLSENNIDLKLRNKIWADISMLMEYGRYNKGIKPYWQANLNRQRMISEKLVIVGKNGAVKAQTAGKISPMAIGGAAALAFLILGMK